MGHACARKGGGLPPESAPADSCFGGRWKSEGIEATLGRQSLRILDALLWDVAINGVSMKHFEIFVLIHFSFVRYLHVCICLISFMK